MSWHLEVLDVLIPLATDALLLWPRWRRAEAPGWACGPGPWSWAPPKRGRRASVSPPASPWSSAPTRWPWAARWPPTHWSSSLVWVRKRGRWGQRGCCPGESLGCPEGWKGTGRWMGPYGMGDSNLGPFRVGHVQGKCPNHCVISLAPLQKSWQYYRILRIWLFIWSQ